ncbi:REX family transcriptional regulator [Porphyromonas gulae]|uniref:redox-sensing transcriptional repressor Rex n=1 Tax=Porphyromonas TaxID=836 RepID=UPI00037CB819|nr:MULTISPECIES: redox-sensing transcriptional repressor Rex [Porphyromonas]KGL56960.1 REX family transcriptional regulator [Porphyromonas sp. COT-052 OH4946]KGN81634.1 REX family transcriptional regulator [Porphyromonas gulae]
MKTIANESSPLNTKVPEPTLRRLPWYLSYVQLLHADGCESVSSTRIARAVGVDASLVAKDLSYVSVDGRTRVGYRVADMVAVLNDFLGFTHHHRAFLFGVGSLGAALLQDSGLRHFGLEIAAGFDVNPDIVDTNINGIPVYHKSRAAELCARERVDIGILTVPIRAAQSVADEMIVAGIKAIWNFTPWRISVPEGVVVQNTSMYAQLAVMFNRMKSLP